MLNIYAGWTRLATGVDKLMWVRILAILLISLANASAVDAPGCVAGHRTLQYGAGAVELHDYACGSGSNGLRLTFYRVGEIVAGGLLMNAANPDIDQIVGRVTFVDNDIYREAKNLFATYGASATFESPDDAFTNGGKKKSVNDIQYGPEMPVGAEDTGAKTWPQFSVGDNTGTAAPTKPMPLTVWYLPQMNEQITSDSLFLKSPSQTILDTDHWPDGYNMYYDSSPDCQRWIIHCTTVWKYIQPADLDQTLHDLREVYQRAERYLASKSRNKATTAKFVPEFEKDYALFKHLAGNESWPADFLYIETEPYVNRCSGSNWNFNYKANPMALDFAIIENLSDRPLQIDELFGVRSESKFRSTAESAALSGQPAVPLGLGPIVLQPQERKAIALRIAFANLLAGDAQPDLSNDGKETYDFIHSKPSDYVFTNVIGGVNSSKLVKKRVSSFKPPNLPTLSDYAYGPEIALSELTVNGLRMAIQGAADNLVTSIRTEINQMNLGIGKITAPNGMPCECPILYSWREDAGAWINHGKVIHSANAPDHALMQKVEIPSFRTRFRLAEEELEATFLDHVQLNVTLKDQRHLALLPKQPIDSVIHAFTAQEFDFDLPPDVSADNVASSEIEIAGYYRRYTSIVSYAWDADLDRARQSGPIH